MTAAPPVLPPGSVPPWHAAAARAAAVVALVVTFGALVQWPIAAGRTSLFAANLVVSAGFAAGSVLLSDEPRHARTRTALLLASLLWSVAWAQKWEWGPLPLLASLTGPAPSTVAIWGLLQFPRPWNNRSAARAALGLLVAMQVASAAMTFTEDHTTGDWWPRVHAPRAHAIVLAVYNDGGVVCAIVLAGLFVVRTARLRGHELRITVPIGVAVLAGGLATALSDTAAAIGESGHDLWTYYAWDALLLACVPASFILSYVLRRVCIEELSGRVDAYDSLPQARDKLRHALRDPTLQILLPAGYGRWSDADGNAHPEPDAEPGRMLVPVRDDHGDLVAAVSVHPSLRRFGDLLTATVQSLSLVFDNARLLARLQNEVRMAEQSHRRVEAAVAAERRQIRHRTGAGPLTLTTSARDQLDRAVALLTADARPVPDALVAARAALTHAADDIRLLSTGAQPLGLGNGLTEAITRVLAVHDRVHTDVTAARADPQVERTAYFVVTAAVGNAIKYAGPDARITVTVTADPADDALAVEVSDDGRGGADPGGHGLTLVAERIREVGGELHITSPAGGGTRIRAVLPRYQPR